MTTREEISAWFDRGVAEGRGYMIIATDTFDYGNYPVYVDEDKFKEEFDRIRNASMQKITEVYNLARSKVYQLNEDRAMHLPSSEGFGLLGS